MRGVFVGDLEGDLDATMADLRADSPKEDPAECSQGSPSPTLDVEAASSLEFVDLLFPMLRTASQGEVRKAAQHLRGYDTCTKPASA